MYHAPEVDGHGVLPVGMGGVGDLAEGRNACVVADDVHAAETLGGRSGEPPHALEAGHVGRDGQDLGPAEGEGGGDAFHRLRVDVGQDDARAPRGERRRHRRADPAAAAGDHRHASAELVHGGGSLQSAMRVIAFRVNSAGSKACSMNWSRGRPPIAARFVLSLTPTTMLGSTAESVRSAASVKV